MKRFLLIIIKLKFYFSKKYILIIKFNIKIYFFKLI